MSPCALAPDGLEDMPALRRPYPQAVMAELARRAAGRRNGAGRPPLGYRVERGAVVPDEPFAGAIRALFAAASSGVGGEELARLAEKLLGAVRWPRNRLWSILGRECYAGGTWGGRPVPALVSREVWVAARARRSERGRRALSGAA